VSYKIVENGGLYDILEKDSSTIIELSIENKESAKGICRKLNLGSGFSGWTPLFIAKKLFT
jgi:hypothetical protein